MSTRMPFGGGERFDLRAPYADEGWVGTENNHQQPLHPGRPLRRQEEADKAPGKAKEKPRRKAGLGDRAIAGAEGNQRGSHGRASRGTSGGLCRHRDIEVCFFRIETHVTSARVRASEAASEGSRSACQAAPARPSRVQLRNPQRATSLRARARRHHHSRRPSHAARDSHVPACHVITLLPLRAFPACTRESAPPLNTYRPSGVQHASSLPR